jgi:hypothetical protein
MMQLTTVRKSLCEWLSIAGDVVKELFAAIALGVGVCAAGAAAAAPGLGEKVYDPYVKSGITEVELRGGRLTGGPENGDSAAVVELEHGFGDRVSLALVAEIEDEPGDAMKLDSVGVEGVVYLGQIPRLGIDVGAYLEYEQRIHNESGVGEAKLLLAKQAGPVELLANFIVIHPFTDKPGEGATQFGYALQATVEAAPGLRLGGQAFGDLGTNRAFGGRQAHYVGPLLRWETRPRGFPGELELEVAYLAAAGAARDDASGQVRFMIEWEKRF